MPPVALLERMDMSGFTFDPVQDTVGDDEVFAERAKDVLGYKVLHDKIVGPKQFGRPLLANLQALDIAPFTDVSVEKYKKSVNYQFACHLEHRRLMHACTWLARLGAVTLIAGILMGTFIGSPYGWMMPAGLVLLLTSFLTWVWSDANNNRMKLSWQSTPLRNFSSELPAEVLQMAIKIKEACPGVELLVTEAVMERVPRPIHDPFLFVRYEQDGYEEKYCVAVWDEPDFNGELLT